ncbi:hypothetical protein V1224_12430 [Lachnospiraceae bacterium JLR.KK008]
METGHVFFLSELLPDVADRFFIDAGGKYLDFAGFCKEYGICFSIPSSVPACKNDMAVSAFHTAEDMGRIK